VNKYAWWYNVVFLLLEFIQSIIGLLTFTFYQPNFTTSFARWFARHVVQKFHASL
jgi:hypothetical protein